jgi:hypothetical protein
VSPEDEQTQRMRSDEGRRASRGLGLPEVDEIELEDPPTVRLGRAKPASPRTPESAEGDQLQLPPGWSTNEK